MKQTIILVLVILLSTINVLASGISVPSFPGGKLTLFQGEKRAVQVVLQNGENRTYTMAFEIVKGMNITSIYSNETLTSRCIIDENNPKICTINMPPYTYDGKVYLLIDTKSMGIGEEQEISFFVRSNDPLSGGMITFGTQVMSGFTVRTEENPNKFKINGWYIAIIIVVLVIGVGGYYWWKRKDEKQQDPIDKLFN